MVEKKTFISDCVACSWAVMTPYLLCANWVIYNTGEDNLLSHSQLLCVFSDVTEFYAFIIKKENFWMKQTHQASNRIDDAVFMSFWFLRICVFRHLQVIVCWFWWCTTVFSDSASSNSESQQITIIPIFLFIAILKWVVPKCEVDVLKDQIQNP